MLKTYKYKLNPNKTQRSLLEQTLNLCRETEAANSSDERR